MFSDLKFALRQLAKTPGFTLTAIVTLAVAIGVNSAIFSIVNGVMLRPIVPPGVVNLFTARKEANRDYRQFSYGEFAALRAANPAFADVAALTFTLAGVGQGNDVRRSFAFFGSENLLPMLGARPAVGRFFDAAEARPNANLPVVVISFPLWQRLGGRPTIVGSTLKVDSRPFTVIGVTPRDFKGINAVIAPDLWLPLGVYTLFTNPMDDNGRTRDLSLPTNYTLNLMGRLQPGLTPESAKPLLRPLEQRLDAVQPPAAAQRELQLQVPSRFSISTSPSDDGPIGALATLLLGMAGVVLLIACLNLANMLLARGAGRAREFAIRLAVGASRWRVVRQLLVEGLALSLAGGVLGLLVAEWSNDLLARSLAAMFRSMNFSIAIELRPDATVAVVTLLLCLAATLVFSLGPALKSARTDMVHDLKQQTGEPAAAGRWNRFFSPRHCLVMVQITLSLVLLIVGGLFLRSAANASLLSPGFETAGGIVAELDYSLANQDAATARTSALAVLARLRRLPGVRDAALATLLPYGNINNDRRIMAAGAAPAADPKAPRPGVDTLFTAITPDYFSALGVPLLAGRTFTAVEAENHGAPPVAIIDRRTADELFPKENPASLVGRRVRYTDPPADGSPAEMEIVGVVSSYRQEVGTEALPPRLFVPLAQIPSREIFVHLRLANPSPAAVATAIGTVRDALRGIDPDLPVLRIVPFTDIIAGNLGLWVVKLGGVLFGAFGFIALTLAVVGVYGVKAYAVARRSREIGIRMALGAMPGDVFALIMRQGAQQTAFAVAAGLALALLLGKALSSMLFNVSPSDPVVMAGAVLVLGVAALLACWLPARRATRISPLDALRSE